MRDKHQIIEEPCEVKVSCTVLKTSGTGDSLAEFNTTQGIYPAPLEAAVVEVQQQWQQVLFH
jgi:putative transposase